jgi:hypothetical protein
VEVVLFNLDGFKISEDCLKLTIDDKQGPRSYNFSKVFAPNAEQYDVFNTICAPVIDELIDSNKSALIFTYGLTNSGKTYTITGNSF